MNPRFELGHVLVIRPGALGDAILTLPVLHTLRVAKAEHVTILGTPASWEFLRPDLDGVTVRDFGSSLWMGLFSEPTALPEKAIGILKQFRTAIVYLDGDVDVLKEKLLNAGVLHVLQVDPPHGPGWDLKEHARNILLSPVCEWLSVSSKPEWYDSRRLAWPPSGDEKDAGWDYINQCRNEIGGHLTVAIHPGSGGKTKCWSAERFAKLAEHLAVRRFCVFVFFGPADEKTQATFEASMPNGVRWFPVIQRPLRDVLTLLNCCHGYVGNDSGITHLANFTSQTFAIFGPTNPAVWSPFSNALILHSPKNDLNELGEEVVLEKVLTFYAREYQYSDSK